MSSVATRVRPIAMLLAGLVATSGSAAAQTRLATNLDTHSEVMIDRPAASIWPYIVDPSVWKRGATARHSSGTPGEVGEVFAASEATDPSRVAYFIENVELVPSQRRTIKLYAPTGALIGFATWSLREREGRTVVGYDVYTESLVDSTQAQSTTMAQLKEAERSSLATNQKRFDDELLALKRLVEKGASR